MGLPNMCRMLCFVAWLGVFPQSGNSVQVVIALAEKYMRSADPRFPVGRTRLETVGVVACAVIMTIATIEVIQTSLGDLYEGLAHGARSAHLLHALSVRSDREQSPGRHHTSAVLRALHAVGWQLPKHVLKCLATHDQCHGESIATPVQACCRS